ncbi:hypothetical protein Patl1_18238 [Pistacia atlantica]|uniref:Uncharacterized protein n=1 Tax=Pistacia atlantica TaxID=434234 RepID=A0ACC1C2H8_9ROSI|nr:hypothetical protein Patl1_18238 [Pistacia atlantica]
MDLNVQIISRETIQPSSPTPSHLKIYKLSLFDQLAPPVYAPIILFYSPTDENDSSERSNHLKKSLSKTLTKFDPFSGRVKDCFSIECNDRGAIFIEALVDCDMSMVLKQPEIDQLQQLLPEVGSDQTLLAVQVNYFGCGGIAGPSLDHPTRVEAVSALIWSAVIAIATERDKTMPIHVATTAVNLPKRLNPPLPQQSIGNIYQVTMANWLMGKTTNYNDLAEKIHESIKKMNNEYIRKLHEGGGYLNMMRNAAEGLGKEFKHKSTALKLNKVAVFLDTSDGKGIEAWVGLSKENMDKF